jgi:hypothetical protein
MSRHHLPPADQIELMRRSYLQLVDPRQVPMPSGSVLKAPEIQAQIYRTMFRNEAVLFPPPPRYRLRVLKRIVELVELAVSEADPEEDV